MMVTILAWTGALLSCLLTIPQAIRTLRSDRLDALSATTYWIILGNAVVWATGGSAHRRIRRRVPALVNGPAALLILRRLHRSQRSVAHVAGHQVSPCEPGLPLQPPPGLAVSACP